MTETPELCKYYQYHYSSFTNNANNRQPTKGPQHRPDTRLERAEYAVEKQNGQTKHGSG